MAPAAGWGREGTGAGREAATSLDGEGGRGGARLLPPYDGTADLYDALVGRYAFDMWRENLERLLLRYPIGITLVADVACGTGLASRYLASRGAEVLACDISPRMLEVAARGTGEGTVRYFRQDMRRLCLPRRVALLICATDALNHLLREEDISLALQAFRAALAEGGYALFDLNTVWQLREGSDGVPWSFEVEGYTMRWTSSWDEERAVATLVMECGRGEGETVVEVHRERGYDARFILEEAKKAGFRGVDVYDARDLAVPGPRTRRLQFVARA